MSVITLISDWYKHDYYIAAVKGRLHSLCKQPVIVDINHQIPTYSVPIAAFILKNSYPFFPKGSIHIIFVRSEAGKEEKQLVVKAHDHYFIGTDSGIFSLLLKEDFQKIIALPPKESHSPFQSLEQFTHAASKLYNGEPMESLGEEIDPYAKRTPMRAVIEDKVIAGSVIYIDSYKNAITNISRDLFERVGNGKAFEMYIQSHRYKISRISNNYSDVPPGELVALFNSANLLEIAINSGNASDLLGLDMNSVVRINFNKK